MASSELERTAQLLAGILARQAGPGRGEPPAAAPPEGAPPAPAPRADQAGSAGIERALEALCAQPGVRGAAVADASGLPVGGRGAAGPPERLAAYAAVLAGVLDSAGRLLGTEGRDRATARLAGEDEALLQRFTASGRTYQLIVVRDVRVGARLDLSEAVQALALALADRPAAGGSP